MTAHTLISLRNAPNSLTPFYRDFRVAERLLLTGHSHQAWPDCAKQGMLQAYEDAAGLIDHKWERAFAKADRVRQGFADLLGCDPQQIALGQSTHELIIRFLSALPLRTRPRLITTDGEFHTLRRQLARVSEEGIEVIRVASQPSTSLTERLCAEVKNSGDRVSAVLVSSVLFMTSDIISGLPVLQTICNQYGVSLLLDVYHQLNVVPFDASGLDQAFVVGGGYKYCQLGEGNCFLRIPEGCKFRPVVTGWYAEFGLLAQTPNGELSYSEIGSQRFAGATYDPTSHYRGATVFEFFRQQDLTAGFLRQVNQHQMQLLVDGFLALDLDPQKIKLATTDHVAQVGGFLALRSPHAKPLCDALIKQGVDVDQRGEILRLGPAPYLCDAQLKQAMEILGQTVRKF